MNNHVRELRGELGWSQADLATHLDVSRQTVNAIETGKPVNAVNPRRIHSGVPCVIRHYNRVGVLAGILHELRNEGINIEEMDNTIFEGELAACCTLILDKSPSAEVMQRISESADVIQAVLK